MQFLDLKHVVHADTSRITQQLRSGRTDASRNLCETEPSISLSKSGQLYRVCIHRKTS
jgi:hypothetical protein